MNWLSAWLVATVSVSFLVSALLLRQLAHPDVKFPAKMTILLSWLLSFTVVWVAPLDLNLGQNDPSVLTPVWIIAYWLTSALTWVIIPLQQVYYDSGHFHFRARMREAFRSNLQFYMISGGLIGVIGITVAIMYGLAAANLLALAMALANIWGLFFMVVFLGYGLVDIPRKLWNFGNSALRTRALYIRAVAVHEEYQDAIELMSDTLSMVLEASLRVKKLGDPELTSYMNTIASVCPINESVSTIAEFTPSALSAEIRESTLSEHLLAKLHYRVKKDYHENRRAEHEWNSLLERLEQIEAQEVEKLSRAVLHRNLRDTFNIHVLSRLVSLIFSAMTIAVIWSEITLSIGVNYSIFYILINYFDSPSTTYLIGFCLISYLAGCTFYSMFKVKLSSFYHLHFGRHSEANSLLFNASYLLRLVFPLSINFFSTTLTDRGAKTSFEQAVGQMNVVPILGQKFNLFVPLVISGLCLATVFNLYGKLLRVLQLSQYISEPVRLLIIIDRIILYVDSKKAAQVLIIL